MMDLILGTGAGFWSPLMLFFSLVIIIALVYLIRSFGEKRYKRGTEQTAPFFSGAQAPGKTGIGDIYWGFFAHMDRYYGWLKSLHSGVVNDYIYLFILTLTAILIILTLGALP